MKRRQFVAAGVAPAFVPFTSLGQQVARVGITLPLTGVQAEVANDLLLGYTMAFDASTARGTEIKVELVDDKADPNLTAESVRQFGADRAILAVSGIVGTPHARAALPKAIEWNLPVVGLRSGAQELRDGNPMVYHLRASYEDELTRMLKMIAGAGLRRLAVVYSNDSFGKGAVGHLQNEAATYGVEIVVALAAERDGANIRSAVLDAVDRKRHPHALALLMIAKPMMAGLQVARKEGGFLAATFAMSFTATREVASAPIEFATGLGMVSAFPLARSSLLPIASDYRLWLTKSKRPPALLHSLTAFEGWMYGTVLADAISRSSARRRESLLQTLNGREHEVGGLEVKFDKARVGYRHLEVLYKSRADGLFRA